MNREKIQQILHKRGIHNKDIEDELLDLYFVSKPFNTRLEDSDGTFNLTTEELEKWESEGFCKKGAKFYGTVLIKEF